MSRHGHVETPRSSGGVGLPGLLLVLFVALKLTGQIDWSWWWVLSPAWLPIVAVLALMVFVAVIGGLFVLLAEWWHR